MPEMLLRQHGFIYSAYGLQIFKEPGGSRYNYQIELGKAFFLHYIVYGDLKYFPRKTASDKVVC